MKHFLTLAISFIALASFSQAEQIPHCHKSFNHQQLKSNTLSVSQIAETEKYDVHYYKLDVSMSNQSTFISGTGEIHGTSITALDSVMFELFSTLTITEIRLNGTPTPFARNASAVTVPVNLTTNQSFEISIDYNGFPPTAASNPLGGSGMSNASSGSWGNQVTWSLSEPFSAYEWWPCKQSLRDKADSCDIYITVPSDQMAGSNGVLKNVVDLGNGTKRFEWEHRHPIDYYLVSVAVAEYVEYNVFANPVGSSSPVLIQNYIYDNPSTLSTFQNDIDETVDFMELFADKFGPYPFDDEKYGHCMAPLSGGMEHQTMTTQGFFEKGLTAHELGHQWWGNSVTCGSWADIWVNEGFASYSEYIMLENLYPLEAPSEMFGIHNHVMSQPGGSTWVLDSLNASRIFNGRLTYRKGSAIVHTFRFIMNDDNAFFQALKNIQTDFADSTAIGLDIRDYFTAASSEDFTEPFNQWYFGEGFPIYSARWNTVGNDLLVEISHTTSSSTPTFTNPIELKFSRTGAADTTIRFDIDYNTHQFMVSDLGDVTGIVSIDPDNWIINETGPITHDQNFTGLGLNDLLHQEAYQIGPNPANDIVTISTSIIGQHDLVLYDTKGKEILNTSFENVTQLDLNELYDGQYILQLVDQSGNKRIKTIVKH